MKYELETIPIWDAYKEHTECPLCLLQDKAETTYIDFFLGNSVMVPEMRVEVNKTGFCPGHYNKLFTSKKNRHGLGLVTHTHFKEQMAVLSKLVKSFGNIKSAKQKDLEKVVERLQNVISGCMICDRIDYTLKRYSFTILYLWKKEAEFQTEFAKSKGFCFNHLSHVLEMCPEVLSPRLTGDFLAVLTPMIQEQNERLEKEIFWYTQKFDYQNSDKPWGTSKDALERTIQKLTGIIQKSSD